MRGMKITEQDLCYGPAIALEIEGWHDLFPEDSEAELDGKVLWLQATEFIPG